MRPSASTRRATRGKEKLFALRDFLGFDENVIVQATCHSEDNRAMADAADRRTQGRVLPTVKRSVTDRELEELHGAGVRGVRFNFVKRLVDFTPRTVDGDRRPYPVAGLARGDLFRGAGPAEL